MAQSAKMKRQIQMVHDVMEKREGWKRNYYGNYHNGQYAVIFKRQVWKVMEKRKNSTDFSLASHSFTQSTPELVESVVAKYEARLPKPETKPETLEPSEQDIERAKDQLQRLPVKRQRALAAAMVALGWQSIQQ